MPQTAGEFWPLGACREGTRGPGMELSERGWHCRREVLDREGSNLLERGHATGGMSGRWPLWDDRWREGALHPMSKKIRELTDETFDEFLVQDGLATMVDFWAEWCAPCKAIAPVVEALAEEYAGRLRVGKLNVDDNPRTASRFSIRGIPTLLIFKNGEVREQVVGAQPKGSIQESLDKVVG